MHRTTPKMALLVIIYCVMAAVFMGCLLPRKKDALCPKYIPDENSDLPGPIYLTPTDLKNCTQHDIEYGCELNYSFLLQYDQVDAASKIKLVRNIEIYDSDLFQCMRFICWTVEQNPYIRGQLLSQWFTIQRRRGAIPSKEELLRLVGIVLSNVKEDDKALRLGEISRWYTLSYLYGKLPWKRSTYFSETPSSLLRHSCGIIYLVDPSEPMSMAIFSTDRKMALAAIYQCDRDNYNSMHMKEGTWNTEPPVSNTIAKATMIFNEGLAQESTANQR